MKKIIISVISLMGLVFACGSSLAATYYVNPEDTIQDVIDSATHGDTVIVYPGIHYENIFFNGKNIVLTSTDPYNQTIVENTVIDASDSGSVVTFDGSEPATCVIQDFTIRNGNAPHG